MSSPEQVADIRREQEKVPTRDGKTTIVRYVWKRAA